MRRWTCRILLPASLALAAILSGCGGGGGSSSSGGSSKSGATVTISPTGAFVPLSVTQQFTAAVAGAKTIPIATSAGAVRASNVVTITTTSAHNSSAGQLVTVSGVSDTSFIGTFLIVAVPSSTTFTYSQTGNDASSGGGNVANVSVNWFVNDVEGGNATLGTITTAGLYTAPDALPPPLTATIAAAGAVRKSNTVTITTTAAHPFVVSQTVIISGVADTSFNGTFNIVTVPNTTSFTYQQLGNDATSGGGTITSFSVKIKAVSVADTTAFGTAVADISSGITVRVTPANARVGTNETVQFLATVIGSSNSAVTWSVNGVSGGSSSVGTITTGGLFTAPAGPPLSNTATINSTAGAVRAFNGAVRSSNVVTVTTSTAHGFTASQSVVIAGASDASFNGTFTITSVPSTTTFTFAQTGVNTSSSGGTATVGSTTVSISTSSVVTITTTTSHGFTVGQTVTIAGVSDTSFNGTFSILTVPSTATFTYAQNGPNATSGGGTATSQSPTVSVTATSVADSTKSATVLVFVIVANNPTLTAISPTKAPQGAVFLDVYLTGTDFLSTTAVRVNGTQLSFATVIQFSSTLIRARIPASLLASTGTLVIDAQRQNGFATSSQNLTVLATRPALVAAGPDSGVQGGGAVTFNVDGGYYGAVANPSITAEFNGSTKSATIDPIFEARRATIAVSGADLATAGLFSVGVRNATNPTLFAATNLAVRPSAAPAVLGSPITVGSLPGAIAINTATGIAVVTNRCSNTISLIDVNALATVGAPIAVGTYPTGVAVDEVRNIAIVVNSGVNTGCAGPAGTPSLSVVDLTAGTVTTTITTGLSGTPFSVGMNPLTGLGILAYQSTNHADIFDFTVSPPVFVSTTTIATGANPQIAVASELNWALVTPGGSGTLSIVDLSPRVSSAIAASGLGRTAGVTTVTTTTAHTFHINQVVRISGAADVSFNGTFTITSVPSSTTFTFAQTGAVNAASGGGTAVTTIPVATVTIGQNARGVAVNPFTQQAMLADPGAAGPLFFNLFDQGVSSVNLNENGAVAAAFNRFTNIGVTTNASTNEASVIDPQIPGRVAKLAVGNAPRAVAIDAGTNTALVVNETDGTVTAIGLGAIRPVHVATLVLPLARQLAPGITLSSGVDLSLTIIGKGFVGGSLVRLDGVALAPPSSVTDRQMTVLVPFALLAGPHDYVLDVLDPGGALSNVLHLTVVQAVDLVGAGGASCTAPAPAAVAIDADRDIAVVANSGCNNASIVDLTTGTITTTLTVQNVPRGVAVSSRLGKAVVTNSSSNTASIIDLTAGPPTVTATVNVGAEPLGVAINEGQSTAIVANATSNTLSSFDLTVATPGAATTPMDVRPVAIAVAPDRGDAVVAHAASNNLALLSLSTLTIVARATNVQLPTGVVFDPTTNLYMANSSLSNQLVIVNPDTLQVTRARAGINPTSLALNFNSSTLVTVNFGSSSISVMDTLDRSIRAVLGIAASSHSAVDIHPRTNLAVILDEAGNRVLLMPLPR